MWPANGYTKSRWGGMLCLTTLQRSCKGGEGSLLLHPQLRRVGGHRDPWLCDCQGTSTLRPPAVGDRRVMAVAAALRQSFIRGTKRKARDWLLLYVTEEEQQYQEVFFLPFILILLQSLSKNNPSFLPREYSVSEPWLLRPPVH